jgi:hypothetical protein
VNRRTRAKTHRPLLFWAIALWLLALGAINLWRSITLWQTRLILSALGSRLSPFASTLLVVSWALCAAALVASAVGLWLRRQWARHTARVSLVVHLALIQAYTWGFVRTGLLWERRWIALAFGVLTTTLAVGALTWPKVRRLFGPDTTKESSTTI